MMAPRRLAAKWGALVGAALWFSLQSLTFAHPEIEAQLAHVSGEIARSPDSAELYLKRGHLHREHRDWPKALLDFRQAGRLDPKLYLVERAIGRVYLEAAKPEQALAQFERFLELQPGDPEGLILRGRTLAKTGEPLKAAADFDAALPKLRRPTPELFLERAELLVAAGEPYRVRALAGLEDGITRLGDLYTLQRVASELEIGAGHPEAALRRVRELLDDSNGNLNWQILEAELLVDLGRTGEARAAYGKALEKIISLPPHRRSAMAVADTERAVRMALDALGVE